MIKTYVLIMIITGGYETGKTSITQEFQSLEQCKYVYTTLQKQLRTRNRWYNEVSGGCFLK